MDKGQLDTLFKLLRKEGLVARQNFKCCQTCGGYDIAVDYGEKRKTGLGAELKGYAFYHRQDAERLFRRDGTCGTYLSYGQLEFWGEDEEKPQFQGPLSTAEVGRLIERCCNQLGLPYEWDGSEGTRFWVGDLGEKRA